MIRIISPEFRDLALEAGTVAAALGYPPEAVPARVLRDIEDLLDDGEGLFRIEGGFRLVEPAELDADGLRIGAEGRWLAVGPTVFREMRGLEAVAVLVATAGRDISDRSRALMAAGNMLKGYLFDTFGSVVVGAVLDRVQEELERAVAGRGLRLTNRYSPGYCGWDISGQRELFALLPDGFCGISLTESCLMLPIKSVSGIVGLGREVRFRLHTCDLCDRRDCLYRNLNRDRGTSAGRPVPDGEAP